MKFSIGDKILVKRTGEEGHVVGFIGKDMMEVQIRNSIFPVYIEEVDHPYLKWFTEKNAQKKKTSLPEQLPVEQASERAPRLAKGVYLSFMPVFKVQGMDEVVEQVKIYLLNELPQAIKYDYDVRIDGRSLFMHEGELHAFGNVYLHSVPYGEMNDQPRFNWRIADSKDGMMAPAEGVLRIRPSKLFEQISKVQESGAPTFTYTLIEDFKPRQKEEEPEQFVPPAVKQATVTAQSIEAPRYEIDLHIEHLVHSTKGLSNADIVHIQLETLQRYLQLAMAHRQERMVVIHGLGKGRLRDEVHQLLKRTPGVARFKNEWSGKYGFGATEIFFRY